MCDVTLTHSTTRATFLSAFSAVLGANRELKDSSSQGTSAQISVPIPSSCVERNEGTQAWIPSDFDTRHKFVVFCLSKR